MKITQIQRFSIDDGPGIRTTVFTSGCNLHCQWCHNPEAMVCQPRVMYYAEKCAGCGACAAVCPSGANRRNLAGKYEIDRGLCNGCFACTKSCAAGARKRNFQEYTAEELLEILLRDRMFYEGASNTEQGGVTFSGGEPMLQREELYEMIRMCRERKIHVAVDSAANVPYEWFEPLLELVNLFLIDCKAWTEEIHVQGTGVSNERILANIRKLAAGETPVWIRIPVIPALNGTKEEMEKIAAFLEPLPVRKIELLPYHRLGINKYELLGLSYSLSGMKTPERQQMEFFMEPFLKRGMQVSTNTI